MPFYAVRVGRHPGIYNTWPECQNEVKGFPNAKYKKFNSQEEAEDFVGNTTHPSPLLAVKKTIPFKKKSESIASTLLKNTKLVSPEDCTRHEFTKRESFPTAPVVYTDGCCLNNGSARAIGGVGVYWAPFHPKNISEYLDVRKPTNQIAELRAASRALEVALEMNLSSLELRTDSVYTIKSMTEWIQRWEANGWKTSTQKDVTNKEEMLGLSALCKKINVKWVHVNGHQGVYGNEEADRLARDGALGRGL